MDSMNEEEDKEDFRRTCNNIAGLDITSEEASDVSEHGTEGESTEDNEMLPEATLFSVGIVAAGHEEVEENNLGIPIPTPPPCSLMEYLRQQTPSNSTPAMLSQLVLKQQNWYEEKAIMSRRNEDEWFRRKRIPSIDDLTDEYVHTRMKEQYGNLDNQTDQYELMFAELKRGFIKEFEAAKEIYPELESSNSDDKFTEAGIETSTNFMHHRFDESCQHLAGRFLLPRKVPTPAELHTLFRRHPEELEIRQQPSASSEADILKLNPETGRMEFQSLVYFDPRFVELSPHSKTFLDVDSDMIGSRLVERCAELIDQHPYGITPEDFKIEFEKFNGYRFAPPLSKLKLKFYATLPDIFYVNDTDFYVYRNLMQTNRHAVTLLFPSIVREMEFNVNEFYYKIWHQFKILLLANRKAICCNDAVALLKDKTGIKFNPLNWGFTNLISYFSDCVNRYPDGIHLVISVEPYYFTRGDWKIEAAPEFSGSRQSGFTSVIQAVATSTPMISDFYITPENKDLNLDVENVADWISEGDYLRGLPLMVYEHFYFFVAVRAYWNQEEFHSLKMTAWYSNPKKHPNPVLPAHLVPGLFVAVECPCEPKYKWHRARIIKLASPSVYKVVFIDSGKISLVDIKLIRYLHVELLRELPIQAIWCKSTYPVETGSRRNQKVLKRGFAMNSFFLALNDREIAILFLKRDASGVWEVRLDELDSNGNIKKLDIIRQSFIFTHTEEELAKELRSEDCICKNDGGLSALNLEEHGIATDEYSGYSNTNSVGMSRYCNLNFDFSVQPMSPQIEEVTEMEEQEIYRRTKTYYQSD